MLTRVVTIIVAICFGIAGSTVGSDTAVPAAALRFFALAMGIALGFVGSLCHFGGDKGRAIHILVIFGLLVVGTIGLAPFEKANLVVPGLLFGGMAGAVGFFCVFGMPSKDDDVE
jgi:hypothetical protein